jgi:hypothetical protein
MKPNSDLFFISAAILVICGAGWGASITVVMELRTEVEPWMDL